MMANTQRGGSSVLHIDGGRSSTSQRKTDPRTRLASVDAESSDKENYGNIQPRNSLGKRKSTSRLMSSPHHTPSAARDKRRRLETGHGDQQSQTARRREIAKDVDTSFYDPDQDEGQKRVTLKRLRDLSSKLQDSRSEYVQRESRGIQDTIREADELIKDVKQTSIATVDSRLLVNVGDLAYKKINTMTLGDSSSGIDVDDFITKCISFMRQTPTDAQTTATQQRQRHNHPAEEEDDEAVDLNWASFGRHACFPHLSRPCLSGFLLGPLSVRKKIRQPTQRRAPHTRVDPSQIVRPVEMTEEERDKQESASLTETCSAIAKLLNDAQKNGEAAVRAEVDEMPEDAEDDEIRQVMRKHHLSSNGGVPLFDFCVNPRSFGQTIENFFYVSFLIKEGKVGLDFDENGLPTLGIAEQRTLKERQETPRNQAVFTLDFETWEDLISSHGIEKSIIPNRTEQDWEDGVIRPEAVIPSDERARAGTVEDEDMYGPG